MPQSALPVSFDAPPLTAKSPAIKISIPPLEGNQPGESFAEHLQKSREAANPAKQKTLAKRSDDTQVKSDTHHQANRSKTSTKETAINTQSREKDVVETVDTTETLSPTNSSRLKTETAQSEDLVDSEVDELVIDLSNQLFVEEDVQSPVAGDLLSVSRQVIEIDPEVQNYSQWNLQPLDLSNEEIPDDLLVSVKPSADIQPISDESLLVEGLLKESEGLVKNLSTPSSIAPTQAELTQTSLTQQSAVILQPAAASPLTAASSQSNLSAIVAESFAFAKDGKDLPADSLVPVNKDTEMADAEMSLDDLNDLFLKGDQKNTKVDQFKLVMGQVVAKEQAIPVEKPAIAPLIAGLQSVANELAPASRLFVPQTQLGVNVQHPQWGRAMGEKILWMANQQLSSADIRLDPPELGSLQVKVSVQQDQASITFITPHPQVRELLDQQAVRLRELFAEQGLNLSHLDIADGRHQSSDDSRGNSQSRHLAADESEEDLQESSVSSLHLVDLHA